MKILFYIFVILSATVQCQIVPENNWPKSIQNEFKSISNLQPDTVLVYYLSSSPWNNIPDSCNGISSIWLLWAKQQEYFAKQILCISKSSNNTIEIYSIPFKYFVKHMNDFVQYKEFIKNQKIISSDQITENLILMTPRKKTHVSLSLDDRNSNKTKKSKLIKSIINAIDTTKYYLNKKNWR
jgi:hypothetical protein